MRTSSAARSFVSQYAKTTALVTVAGVGLFGLKKWIAGGVCNSKARLDGKTVLITGANTGIGKETAVDMARRGARVILACRDMEKANKAAEEVKKRSGNDSVIVRKLDLASLQSIRQLAKDVLASEERLDVLINNAGIMSCPKWKTEDGFEMQFGVNHLGHFLLTNCLLDLLKKSSPSRIVNVSSLAHERGTGVTAYSLHPGVIHTELGRHFWPTVPLWKRVFYMPLVFFVKNPTEGAQTTIYCAVEESLQNESGLYYRQQCPSPPTQHTDTDTKASGTHYNRDCSHQCVLV
ncbi:retinol dehydrogenase 13 isoform X3 [Oreochromis niloticus]|uniref:retinol dehydrogenase 13 isoform X3 n=1 Tax=Oreochromis niloticus TaxID=8128 RepID=UPI00039405B2|nr:retinol dehydrogenase 13 isoform X3 [Oreochromis niloticus]